MKYRPRQVQDVDLYAVRLVVREGCRNIALNRTERLVAAHLLKRKGFSGIEAAERLDVTHDVLGRYWRTRPPIDMDAIDPAIIGNPVGVPW